MRWIAVIACRKCRRVKYRDSRYSQMHPICPNCDRVPCGRCKVPVLDPFVTVCQTPGCGAFVGFAKEER